MGSADVLVAMAFFLLCNSALYFALEDYYSQCLPFDCGNVKNITYPFFNLTNPHPGCGYSSISCENETPMTDFIFIPGRRYKVENIFNQNQTIIVQDTWLYDAFNSEEYKDCHSLLNFEEAAQPLYLHFNVTSPILTIFLCERKNKSRYRLPVFQNSYSYGRCEHYDLFFNITLPQIQSNPPGCVLIHIPVSKELPAFNGTNLEEDDFASLFKAGFHVQWVSHPEEAGTHHKNKKLIIGFSAGGGGGGGILITCFIFFLISRFRKRKLSNISNTISSGPSCYSDLEKDINYLGLPVFTYSELEEATDNFDSSKELGDGGFGTVYHGKLRDGRFVAVKRLYEHNYKRVEQFMNEVDILTRLRHQNLVTLYGCTSRRSRELLLVYEYIPNGTVADHLHSDRAKAGSLTWPIRMNIAIETASALAYLHASDIIHRDVKTNNILLDNNFCVKVADFGLSRLFPLDASHVSTAPQGTPGYVDPEYHQCYQLTDRSDVYSFGVVLIELISSKPAVDISRNRYEINLATMAINKIQNCLLYELVDPYLAFEEDYTTKKMIEAVAELAFQCLQYEKDMRPSMNEVLERLKGIEIENYRVKKMMEVNIIEDEVGLVKNSQPSASPDSVADKWVSVTTTPNTSG